MKDCLLDMNSKGYAFLGTQIKDEDVDWFAKDIFSKKKTRDDPFWEGSLYRKCLF